MKNKRKNLPSRGTRVAATTALAAATLLSMVACSTGTSPVASDAPGSADAAERTDVPEVAPNKAAVKVLPESIKTAKVLKVGIPTNEQPTQYYISGTKDMTGLNPDIARLIGAELGVKVEIKVANFDAIIPGMAADRYDMTVSSMAPTKERMKVLDFVDYAQMGNSIAVAKGNPAGITKREQLCGKKVGLLTGSYQLTARVPEYDKACVASDQPKIQTNQYKDTRQAISALTSGRMDAVLADSPILDFASKKNPGIEISSRYDLDAVAVGVPKDSGLVKPVSLALAEIIEGDAYKQVLAKYGLESSATTEARVNFAQ